MVIKINKADQTPLYRQLGDALIEKIISGEISSGERLPAIRRLATELDVNNITIINAYKYLEQKQAAYSVRGSGTFALKPIKTQNSEPSRKILDDCINFAAAQTSPGSFPAEAFRHAFDAVLARDGAGAFDYPGWRGYLPLRESICKILATDKITASPENIQIVPGIRKGIDIVLDTLISPGDAVFVQSPTMRGITEEIIGRGAKIVGFPKCKPKLFFLSPSYPSKADLCYNEIAKVSGAYIIEADDEFNPKPFKARNNRVIYIKSFDRVLAPGLAGYIVCDAEVLNDQRDVGEVSGYIQRSLDFYLRNNDFSKHCAIMRSNYRARAKKAAAAAETYLAPYASFTIPEGGCLWVSPFKMDAAQLNECIKNFVKRKVLVSPGHMFAGGENYFRINFFNTPEEDILTGIGIIASVLAEACNTRNWR
ncbi:MAG: PLP-dependent aminotransferase family protein [Defluviitaleaceae bacterium]|nr:PLP-dependent aminotransferase family protein [Defluviitaleaceae bacterium]